jgi:hypothetical protein
VRNIGKHFVYAGFTTFERSNRDRGTGRPPPSHTTGHAGPHPAVQSGMTKTRFVLSAFSFGLHDTVFTLTVSSQPSAYPPRSI